MEDNILNLIKRNYVSRKERKTGVYNLLRRIKELNESEVIKEYLALVEQLNSIDYIGIMNQNDINMLSSAFRTHLHLINKTNGIYLCMGSFMYEDVCDVEHGPRSIRLSDDDPRVQYKVYMDIEQEYGITLPIEKCQEFESNNKVIFTDNLKKGEVYYAIQEEFIATSLEVGQEKACEKILSRKW